MSTPACLFRLDGRVALVTGGGGWLGVPIASGLAEAGAHVIVTGRRLEPLAALVDQLRGAGYSTEVRQMDVTQETDVTSTINAIRSTHGRLDVIVNNAMAPIAGPRGLDAPAEAFEQATVGAATAAWRLIVGSLDLLKAAVALGGDASVINVASMYGKVSPDPAVYADTGEPPNPAYYGSAKAGLIQLSRWLACNLGRDGIRVNSVSPGPFPQWNAREQSPDFVARLDAKTALGRVGERDEIKGVVVFLASRAASFVTGADLAVDGGWTSYR